MTFPLSKACLWDTTSKGDTLKLHLTTPGWIQLKVNTNAIKLAVRHASLQLQWQQEAFLMATPMINKDDSVTLEVNRFDPGKWNGHSLSPTTLLPGDMPLHCKLINDVSSIQGHLTHNISTLQEGFISCYKSLTSSLPSSVVPFYSLLSLRVIMFVWKNTIQIKWTSEEWVRVGVVSGQSLRVFNRFLTMNETRKLIPILSTDSHAHTVPVIGIWLSDVSFSHPAVWSMALQYSHSTQLHKVTHEGKFLLLITHNHDYQLWQCTVEPLKWVWHLSGVEPINFSTDFSSSFLMPLMEGVAGHTLLQSASDQWSTHDKEHSLINDDSCPLPTLHVTPNGPPTTVIRDSDLSCLSVISNTGGEEREGEIEIEKEEEIEQLKDEEEGEGVDHRRHLLALHQQVQDLLSLSVSPSHKKTTPTPVTTNVTPTMVTIATNTGRSLLYNSPPTCNRSIQADTDHFIINNSDNNSSLSSSLSLPYSLRTLSNTVSMATQLECSSNEGTSLLGVSDCNHSNERQLAYLHEIKKQVQEMLDSSFSPSSSPPSSSLFSSSPPPLSPPLTSKGDLSLLPVPKIRCPSSTTTLYSIENTLDEHWNMADLISQKYLTNAHISNDPTHLINTYTSSDPSSVNAQEFNDPAQPINAHASNSPTRLTSVHTFNQPPSIDVGNEYSVASREYLKRHGLINNTNNNKEEKKRRTIRRNDKKGGEEMILDIPRLKELSKLL